MCREIGIYGAHQGPCYFILFYKLAVRHFELAIRYFELAIATLNSRFSSLNRTSDDHYEVAIATLS